LQSVQQGDILTAKGGIKFIRRPLSQRQKGANMDRIVKVGTTGCGGCYEKVLQIISDAMMS